MPDLVAVDTKTKPGNAEEPFGAAAELAHRNPRDLAAAIAFARAVVEIDEESAAECFYTLKKNKGDGGAAYIEGPSSRFAEIMLSAWGNAEAGARVLDVGAKFVRVEGFMIDLERNAKMSVEVARQITGRTGRRYSENMIQTTANAACSIAIRNAILKGIPKPIWRPIYEAARKMAVGDASTLEAKRDAMLSHFEKLTVTADEVARFLDRKSIAQIDVEDLVRMRGIANAIREGDTTIDESFGRSPASGGKIGQASKIKGIG